MVPTADAAAVPEEISGGVMQSAVVMRVDVDIDVDVDVEIQHAELADGTFRTAWGAAEGARTAVLNRLRVDHGQYFVGPSHVPPKLHGKARMLDVATGKSVPGAWPPNNISIFFQEEERDDRAAFEDAAKRVAGGDAPDVADILLADAREEVGRNRVHRDGERRTFDTTRAVLLAAFAAETKIKTTMVARSPVDRRPLVEIIAQRPRDIGRVTHAPMKAAVGRSLHEDEPQTYEALINDEFGLFPLRNQIAHTLRVPTEGEATGAVFAAVALFAWLASL
jgi:hypothetical protein